MFFMGMFMNGNNFAGYRIMLMIVLMRMGVNQITMPMFVFMHELCVL
jgi:hypothetical protein